MPRTHSYLAGTQATAAPLLIASLVSSGFTSPTIADSINVTELGLAVPDLLVLDVDDLDIDALELLRMTRFVLPLCMIAVYSGTLRQSWALACHLAGANCLLAKSSDKDQIVTGLRQAFTTGCFTDPSFASA